MSARLPGEVRVVPVYTDGVWGDQAANPAFVVQNSVLDYYHYFRADHIDIAVEGSNPSTSYQATVAANVTFHAGDDVLLGVVAEGHQQRGGSWNSNNRGLYVSCGGPSEARFQGTAADPFALPQVKPNYNTFNETDWYSPTELQALSPAKFRDAASNTAIGQDYADNFETAAPAGDVTLTVGVSVSQDDIVGGFIYGIWAIVASTQKQRRSPVVGG